MQSQNNFKSIHDNKLNILIQVKHNYELLWMQKKISFSKIGHTFGLQNL